MNTDNHINEYIRKEKELKPTPFLATRIMAQIEELQGSQNIETRRTSTAPEKIVQLRLATRWQSLAIAASFALVIAMGIGAGSLYTGTNQELTALTINDNLIENRSFLNTLAYE